MITINDFTTSNGLRVIYTRTTAGVIAAQLRMNNGWYHERQGEEGLAHLTEHVLCGSSTQKYTVDKVREITETFGQTNAKTDPEHLTFFGTFLPEQLPLWLNLTSQQAYSSLLDEDILERECSIVLREMTRGRSGLHTQHSAMLRNMIELHPKNAQDGYGSADVIINVTREQLAAYYQRGFNPANTTLFLAGNLPSNIEEMVERHINHYPSGSHQQAYFSQSKLFDCHQRVEVHAPYLENPHDPTVSLAILNLFYRFNHVAKKDEAALSVAVNILGKSGQKSLLHKMLREESRLCYEVNVGLSLTNRQQLFSVETQVHPSNLKLAEQKILECTQRMQQDPLPETTFKRIERDLRFTYALLESNLDDQMGDLLRYADFQFNPADFHAQLCSVTPGDVQRVSQLYFPTTESPYLIFIRNPHREL